MRSSTKVSPTSDQTRLLFAWQPDRNWLRWDEAVYTDDGEDIIIWDGMTLEPSIQLNLMKPRKGRIADFLYTPLLKLFVSGRALEVIARAHVPGIAVNQLNLRDKEGALIESYFWINVAKVVPLLDRERSDYQQRDPGGVSRIDRLVILSDAVPEDELFLFKEIAGAVFSQKLVEAIRAARLTGIKFEPLDDSFRWPV